MRSAILAGGALLCGPAAAFAQSCAMCGSSFSPNDPATRAFTWSIIFLLLVPYTIFGLAAGFVFWSFRRASNRPRGTIIPMAWRRRPTAPVGGPEEA